ncbi:MAG: peptidoglycan D,D-transpeptidase FtsI family protein [Actinomycetota bacterium]
MARRGARPALRLFAALAAMTVSMVAIVAQLIRLQIVDAASLETLGAKQRVRSVTLPARRGTIYDRNMVPLAISIPARALYANPHDVVNPETTADALSVALGIEKGLLLDRLTRDSSFVYLARKVEVPLATRVLALNLPGIGAFPETKRVYPQGTLGAQVVGFVGTDDTGLAGIEAGQDSVLAGVPGREVTEVDPNGHPIPHGRSAVTRPKAGKDVVLTIDRNLQFATEDALDRALLQTGAPRAAAVLIDPRTGEVLAMANRPALDPQLFGSATPISIRNRVVQDAYEPGSVNKLITAAAAIEGGIALPSDVYSVPDHLALFGKVFHDFAPHKTERWSYNEILAHSSNIGTIKVAQQVGRSRLYAMLRKFGLGEPTRVGFPGESAGILTTPDKWSATDMATIPIGQGIAVTPLQMAAVYAAIANNGVWTQPTLIKRLVADGKAQPRTKPVSRRVISSFTAAQLRGMLLGVVETGTGKPARISGYLIGGKTGTARVPLANARGYSNQVMTTFIGIVPVESPRLVAAVVMDNPAAHIAAATAAPTWRNIVQFALGFMRIPPSYGLDPADDRRNRSGTP